MGSSLMQRIPKLHGIVRGMNSILGSTPLTIKMRTGWEDKRPTAHNLVNQIQKWVGVENCNVAAVMVHGRSRQQRYVHLISQLWM
jgi:tRNA-dihydrouridine synthase 3